MDMLLIKRDQLHCYKMVVLLQIWIKHTNAADVSSSARALHEPLSALHHVESVASAVILDFVLSHELLVQRETSLVCQNRVIWLQLIPEQNHAKNNEEINTITSTSINTCQGKIYRHMRECRVMDDQFQPTDFH